MRRNTLAKRRQIARARRGYAYRGYEEDAAIIKQYMNGAGDDIDKLVNYLETWLYDTFSSAQMEIENTPEDTPQRKRALKLIQSTNDAVNTLIDRLAQHKKFYSQY